MRTTSSMVGVLSLILFSAPASGQPGEKVTGSETEKIRQAIADYIQRDTKLKGGFFLYDPERKGAVELKFDHVHQGVTRTAAGHYFACVDMRSVRGPLYDLDVYMEQTDEGVKPVKLVIHKVDGKKREKTR